MAQVGHHCICSCKMFVPPCSPTSVQRLPGIYLWACLIIPSCSFTSLLSFLPKILPLLVCQVSVDVYSGELGATSQPVTFGQQLPSFVIILDDCRYIMPLPTFLTLPSVIRPTPRYSHILPNLVVRTPTDTSPKPRKIIALLLFSLSLSSLIWERISSLPAPVPPLDPWVIHTS